MIRLTQIRDGGRKGGDRERECAVKAITWLSLSASLSLSLSLSLSRVGGWEAERWDEVDGGGTGRGGGGKRGKGKSGTLLESLFLSSLSLGQKRSGLFFRKRRPPLCTYSIRKRLCCSVAK